MLSVLTVIIFFLDIKWLTISLNKKLTLYEIHLTVTFIFNLYLLIDSFFLLRNSFCQLNLIELLNKFNLSLKVL